MRLLWLCAALLLGCATPVAAGVMLGSSPFGIVKAAGTVEAVETAVPAQATKPVQVSKAVISAVQAADAKSVAAVPSAAAATAAAAEPVHPAPSPDASTAEPVESTVASTESSAVTATVERSPDGLIAEWISELSNESGFEAWKSASWTKYPLGPGKRGWAVIVRDNTTSGQEIGYLVVIETKDGRLQLEEYGVGETPLFSMRTLEWTLQSEGLEQEPFTENATYERVYFDALHAYWKVSEGETTRYADAKSGEWLPIGEQDVQELLTSAEEPDSGSIAPTASKPIHWMAEKVADPYLSIGWITAKPLPVRSLNDLVYYMDSKGRSPVYSADLFEGTILMPFGVAGVHAWSPDAAGIGTDIDGSQSLSGYVALEHEGLRYVQLSQLMAYGSFR